MENIYITVHHALWSEGILQVHGRVTEKLLNADNKNRFSNILFNIEQLLIRGLSKKTLTLKANGKSFTIKSNYLGYFNAEFSTDRVEQISVRIGNSIKNHSVSILSREISKGIISDIDDTILKSYSYRWYKNLYTFLTNNANTRKAFPYTASLYSTLEEKGRQVFYISSSSYYLFHFLKDFLKYNKFPNGTMLLRPHKTKVFGWRSFIKLFRKKPSHSNKLSNMKKVMNWCPNMKVICVGDTGQQDAKLYTQLAEYYPDRVEAVYLREAGKQKDSLIQEAKSKLERLNIPFKVFKDTSSLHL